MFKSIQTKIMFFLISLATCLIILAGMILIIGLTRIVTETEEASLESRAIVSAAFLSEWSKKSETVLTEKDKDLLLDKETGKTTFLLDQSGKTLWAPAIEGEPFLAAPEGVMDTYQLDFPGEVKIQDIYKNQQHYIVAMAKMQEDGPMKGWYVVTEKSASEVYRGINNLKTLTIIVAVVLLMILWGLGKRISFAIQRPIRDLERAASQIAEGDISHSIETKEGGELAGIAESFNQMLDNLKGTMQQVLLKSGEAAYMQDIMDYVKHTYDDLPGGIVSINNIGEVTTFNVTAAELTGFSTEEMLGRNIENPMPMEIKPLIDSLRWCLGRGKLQLKKITDIGNTEGERIPILYSTNIHFGLNSEVIGAICVFKRLEDIARFEASALRARNLGALGEMAASLAHEIKNPLTSIRGYAQYIHRELGEKDMAYDELGIIIHETDRLTAMLDGFLRFARPEVPEMEALDIRQVLGYVVKLLEREIPKNITIETHYKAVPQVLADSAQFEALFLNLLLNAVQAMPEGGVIHVRTGYDDNRDMVCVEIQDNGKGIPQELSEKIFQPFFTTRDEGTGMGLAICSRIVETHQGVIELESIEGEMCKFSVLLQAFRPERIL